jgi:replication factor C large subunit
VGRTTDLSDRGGLGAITRLVKSTRQPIVLTVNDDRSLTRYSPVFRTGVMRVRFYPVRDSELSAFVQKVARSERIELHPGALDSIVKRARGDVRAALNDLEAIAPLAPGPWQLSVLGFRDLEADFVALTEDALAHPRYFRNVEVQDRLDATPDDLLPWIEENLPLFAPDAFHRDAAYRVLAVAERFLARARRARTYGLWSYASELMTGGVSLALHDRPVGGGGIAFPQFLSEMGRSRGMRTIRDSLAEKAGHRFHLSISKSREVVLPFLERVFAAASGRAGHAEIRRVAAEIVRELELSPEEVGFLLGAAPDARSVTDLRARAASPAVAEESRGKESATPESSARSSPSDAGKRVQRQLSEFGGG